MRNLLSYAIIICILGLFLLNSCLKRTIIQEADQAKIQRFYSIKGTPKPEVQKVINEFKRQNDLTNFIPDFISRYGYPIWDKVKYKIVNNSSISKSSNHASKNAPSSTINDSILIIPVLQENPDSFVSAAIFANVDNNNVNLEMWMANQYKEFLPNNSSNYDPNNYKEAQKYLLYFAALNSITLEKDFMYKITDPEIFNDKSNPEPNFQVYAKFDPDEHVDDPCWEVQTMSSCFGCITWKYEWVCICKGDDCNGNDVSGGNTGTGGGWHWGEVPSNPNNPNGTGGVLTPTGTGTSTTTGSTAPNDNNQNNNPCFGQPYQIQYGAVFKRCSQQYPTFLPDERGWEYADTITKVKENPCDRADSLTKDTTLNKYINLLEQRVLENVEYAYSYQRNADGTAVNVKFDTGNVNTGTLDIKNSNRIDVLLHCHYADLLSIFSAYDVQYLAKSARRGGFRDIEKLIYGVVTASGTKYLITVNNLFDFYSFIASLKDENNLARMYKDLSDNGRYDLLNTNTVSRNERNFLNYLNEKKLGLNTYKFDENDKKWHHLVLDANGKVKQINCN